MVVLAATPAERHPQPANSNLGSPSISTAMLAGHIAGKRLQLANNKNTSPCNLITLLAMTLPQIAPSERSLLQQANIRFPKC